MRLSFDPDLRYQQELRERTIRDINSALHTREQRSFAKGFEKGFKKGVEQTKLENARNLLDILDDETIAEKIGLELQKVIKMREEMNIYLNDNI